jgi:hypothetical protein
MSNGGGSGPRFNARGRWNSTLSGLGCTAWTTSLATAIEFVTRRANPRVSPKLPFVLDTGAFVSAIPERWLGPTGPRLQRFTGQLSRPVEFSTVAGENRGRMVRAVPVRFPSDPAARVYRFDFLVTPGLDNRGYGLISWRDVVGQFDVETEGIVDIGSFGEPIQLPDLVLIPRGGFQRIRYRCPGCGIETWGRPGLHLICGDNNVQMVAS